MTPTQLPRVTAAVILAVLLMGSATTPSPLEAQDVSLERFERWHLYSAPGAAPPTQTALLLLHVRNDTDYLVKRWHAMVVVRDSTGVELFRVAIEKERADLAPGERSRVEMQFADRPDVPGEPYDHLLGNDTTNLRITFDEVRIVDRGEVAYVRAAVPICFAAEAWERLAAARYTTPPDGGWRTVVESVGCQWSQVPLTVEFLEPVGTLGARVRLALMTQNAWICFEDLERR